MSSRQPTRGERRAREREQRITEFWSERAAAAKTPAEQAAVAYQWVRARIRRVPVADQDTAWQAFTAYLAAFAAPNSHANFASNVVEIRRPTRTDAPQGRARAREATQPEGA